MKTASTLKKYNTHFNIGDRVFVETSASEVKTGTVYGKWSDFGIDVLFDDRQNQTYVINLMHEKVRVLKK